MLKSWAVPKGPSLDPEDKRLAMQVEDHPVSYFDFEGTIPEDNYGAGTVMVWDVGTWQPLSPVAVDGKYVPGTEAEAAAMMAKGDLKFRLNGKRLKGDFALVKMKGRRPGSKGNEWLMIKKHDDHVVEGYDRGTSTNRCSPDGAWPRLPGMRDRRSGRAVLLAEGSRRPPGWRMRSREWRRRSRPPREQKNREKRTDS